MKFDKLCENYTIYKQVKREFYPKQIKFTPDFLKALRGEYGKQQVDENNTPINNKRVKFLKALNFYLRDLDNGVVSENMTQGEALKKEVQMQKKGAKGANKERGKILGRNIGQPASKSMARRLAIQLGNK